MIPISQETTCHYLFGKEASELGHPTSKLKSKFSDDFINKSLETLIKVNIAFLSKKENDGFSFIDPCAHNNQCHLYALFAAKIKKDYKTKSGVEKQAKTQDNRFLHLAFLLSYTFINDRPVFLQAIEKELSTNKDISYPDNNKKLFCEFVHAGLVICSARKSLNEFFESRIKATFEQAKDKDIDDLHREFYKMSLEDLRIKPDGAGSKASNDPLYTLPKIVGVAYLIDENLSYVVKTKVITKNGTGELFFQGGPPAYDDDPVLVFEGVASDTYSIDAFRQKAKRCPSYFERNVNPKNRDHMDDGSCDVCNTNKAKNFSEFEERFTQTTACMNEALYALGADFMREMQKSFLKYVQDDKKYPEIAKLFQKGTLDIDRLQVSMDKPLAFSIDHVYADSAKRAQAPGMRMNCNPTNYLKSMGYL